MNKRLVNLNLFVLICFLSLLGGCGQKRSEVLCEYLAEKELHSAITPVDRADEWWQQRHEQILERIRQEKVDLIFIGDSITHSWESSGKEVWQEYYGARNAVNMGFSGDQTQHVLWRLAQGEIEGIAPKAAVLMIGTNNSNGNDNTAEEISEGIMAIVCELRERLPETKVLILAIFPRGEKPSGQRHKNTRASELAASLADGEMIHYLNIGRGFLEDDGTLTQEIMPDYLHLTPAGYRIWAESIEDKLKELMVGDK